MPIIYTPNILIIFNSVQIDDSNQVNGGGGFRETIIFVSICFGADYDALLMADGNKSKTTNFNACEK
jgi:hypothetical protein